MELLRRLNTDENLTPYQGQVVPVKLDVSTDEYKEFRRQHKPEGNTIPRVFVVRADGETMFAKSTSLKGDLLFELLDATIQNSGRILTSKEVDRIVEVHSSMKELHEKGKVAEAIKLLKKIRKVGQPWELNSYATSAVSFVSFVNELTDEGRGKLEPVVESLGDTESDEESLLAAMTVYLSMKERYGDLQTLKNDFNAIRKSISKDKNQKELLSGLKVIEKAQSLKSANAINRSIEKLEKIVVDRAEGALVVRAKRQIDKLKKRLQNEAD